MGKISEFLMEHWIIILSINCVAIIFIIGYLIEQENSKKNEKHKNENKIIFDNDESKFVSEEKIVVEKQNNEKENIIDNEENSKLNKNKNINSIDEETKKQIHENIDYIINQSNSVFEEFEKIIPEKKIIDDKVKEELEIHDENEKPKIEYKKNIDIDTNIVLPEIDLSTNEDIWD